MISCIKIFKALNGTMLEGILNKCKKNTDSILIQIHGMTK